MILKALYYGVLCGLISTFGWPSNSVVPGKISTKLYVFHKMHKFWPQENVVHNCDDYQSGAAEVWETML